MSENIETAPDRRGGQQASLELALKSVLSPTKTHLDSWLELAESGATDEGIRSILTFQVGPNGRTDSQYGICCIKVKPALQFWYNSYAIGNPTLRGTALVDKVREIFSIPLPPGAAASSEALPTEPAETDPHGQEPAEEAPTDDAEIQHNETQGNTEPPHSQAPALLADVAGGPSDAALAVAAQAESDDGESDAAEGPAEGTNWLITNLEDFSIRRLRATSLEDLLAAQDYYRLEAPASEILDQIGDELERRGANSEEPRATTDGEGLSRKVNEHPALAPPPAITMDDPGVIVLPLAIVRTDGGTQPRAELADEVVSNYAELYREGRPLPPPVAFFDGIHYWLADGFHRVAAASRAGFEDLEFDVRSGSQRDAILYSVGANADHGLPRSNADKRRAVETLLKDPEWSQWSDRVIAKQCGVSHTFVGEVRRELSGSGLQMESSRRVRRGDSQYSINTGNIGGTRPAAEADESDLSYSFCSHGELLINGPWEARIELVQDGKAMPHTCDGVKVTASTDSVLIAAERARIGQTLEGVATKDDKAEADGKAGEAVAPHSESEAGESDRSPQSTAQANPPAVKDSAAEIEAMLNGRVLSVTYTYIPALKGKVSVGVRVGDDLSKTRVDMVDSSKVRHTSNRVIEMIAEQFDASDKRGAEKRPKKNSTSAKPVAKKPAVKSAAKKSSSPQAKPKPRTAAAKSPSGKAGSNKAASKSTSPSKPGSRKKTKG